MFTRTVLYFRRVTAFGCECGYVRICRVSVKANTVIYSHTVRFDNFITTLRIYSETDSTAGSANISSQIENTCKDIPVLNLIVLNSVLPPVFFR